MSEHIYRFVATSDPAQQRFIGTLHRAMIDTELEMVTTCSGNCAWHGPLHLFQREFQRVEAEA